MGEFQFASHRRTNGDGGGGGGGGSSSSSSSNIATIISSSSLTIDRLCGLVVRVSGYRYRGLEFDSRRFQIF